MSDAGLPNPEYTLNSFLLTATIRNKIDGSTKNVVENVVDNNAKKVLEFIKENPNVTLSALAEKMSITKRTVDRIIKHLKEKGIIERVGSDRKGYWKIK